MDPAGVVDLAVKTYKVLAFTIEVVTDTVEVYKSPDGMTKHDAHMGTLERDLDDVAGGLAAVLAPVEGSVQAEHTAAIVELAKKAQAKCGELGKILSKLKVANGSRWRVAKSLRAVLASMWKRSDVKALHTDLHDYRSALILRLNVMQIEESLKLSGTLADVMAGFQRRASDKHALEWRVCERIKNQLYFENIHDREDHISDADEQTLSWFLDAEHDEKVESTRGSSFDFARQQMDDRATARNTYRSWLDGAPSQQTGERSPDDEPQNAPTMLHVLGKAGSGKSTLMRYLCTHSETDSGLRRWAGERTLLRASFYFWAISADSQQKSLEGLYRSVLYQVLSACPELAAYVFCEQWSYIQERLELGENDAHNYSDGEKFRPDDVKKGFQRLLRATGGPSSKYCLCLFVDGLDEYGGEKAVFGTRERLMTGDFQTLIRAIVDWSKSAHVKICTSSRPYADFVHKFAQNSAAVLHLHDLNINDIFLYCQHKFEASDDIGEEDEASYTELSRTIAQLSEGVFLWAYYMVQIMVVSYENGDSESTRMEKLYEVNPNLEDLYGRMLSLVPATDRPRSNALLLLALDLPRHFYGVNAMWALWLDRLHEDAEFPTMEQYFPPYSQEELDKKLITAHKRISLWTCGLLQREPDTQYFRPFHRTAVDFLKTLRASGRLTSTLFDGGRDSVFSRLSLAEFVYLPHRHARHVYFHEDRDMFRAYVRKMADIFQLSTNFESPLVNSTDSRLHASPISFGDISSIISPTHVQLKVTPISYVVARLSFMWWILGSSSLLSHGLEGLLQPPDKFLLLVRSLENPTHIWKRCDLPALLESSWYLDSSFRSYLDSQDSASGYPMWAILAYVFVNFLLQNNRRLLVDELTTLGAAILPQASQDAVVYFIFVGDERFSISDLLAANRSPEAQDVAPILKNKHKIVDFRFYYEPEKYISGRPVFHVRYC